MSGFGQIVTLGIGDGLFAIPVERVQEILDSRPIMRLPNAPAHLQGVIDVRGQSVSVASLHSVLGVAPEPDTEATRIVVFWVAHEGRRAVLALKADRVIEVCTLDEDTVGEVPEARLFNWKESMITGIGRYCGRFVTVLDLDHMFDVSTLNELSGVMAS